MENAKLVLNEFIGKGTHKKTFLYPGDDEKCIKVAYNSEGVIDLLREIDYRELREQQGLESKMMPKYYGKVATDLGDGYVFERIVDFDGSVTKSLQDYLEDEKLLKNNFENVRNVMIDFKRMLFAENILTMGIFPENILIQKVDNNVFQPRIINDMGCATFIKLEYYFVYFRNRKILKRWQNFYDYIKANYTYDTAMLLLKQIGR